jgi:hypothetical protein
MIPKSPSNASSFPAKRVIMYRKEVAQRAGVFFRLGYTVEQARARLAQNAVWEFESGADEPDGLSEQDIADIVAATYARRPAD